MGAVREILADERLGGTGTGLNWLQVPHGLLEAVGEVPNAIEGRVGGTAEEFTRQPERGPVDEFSGGVVEVLLERGTYSEEDQGQGCIPVLSWLAGSHEGSLELSMEPFHCSVGLGVVAGGPVPTDSQKSHDSAPHAGLELTPTVGRQAEGDTESRDPRANEGTGDGVGGDVSQWCSFGPSCETVDASQDVPVTTGVGKRSNQVNVDMIEA